MSRRGCGYVMAIVAVLWATACADNEGRAFNNRDRLPSCGTHALDHVQGPPADAVACLLKAAGQRRGAELAITRPTVEGDTVVTYYRSRPGKPGFEIFTDNTKDRYRSVDWDHRICEDLKLEGAELAETGCSPAS